MTGMGCELVGRKVERAIRKESRIRKTEGEERNKTEPEGNKESRRGYFVVR